MGIGLLQLVAYDMQNEFLTGNPSITLFKFIYRRHTNFSIEPIPLPFMTKATFGKKVTCLIPTNGDLIHKSYLYVDIPSFICPATDYTQYLSWSKNLGHALIKQIEIEISGKIIDRQYGEWMHIFSQLTEKQPYALNKLIGNEEHITTFSNKKDFIRLYIPLTFWFCKYVGSSLPIIALRNSDVKIHITFRDLNECINVGPQYSIQIIEPSVPFEMFDYIEQEINGEKITGIFMGFDFITNSILFNKIKANRKPKEFFESYQTTNIINNINIDFSELKRFRIKKINDLIYVTPKINSFEVKLKKYNISIDILNSFLLIDYIYLDINERTRYARTKCEYLIEQILHTGNTQTTTNNTQVILSLKYPIKTIFWICQIKNIGDIDLFNYTDNINPNDGNNNVLNANIKLNSLDRFNIRDGDYFNFVQPYHYFNNGPIKGINVYSFSINPENQQPSGALNMSTIPHATLNLNLSKNITQKNYANIRYYAIAYNVFKVEYGLGGLVFN